MKEGVITENVKYVWGNNTMYIDNSEDGVLITTINDKENTQHDIPIGRKDWELIKMIIDNFVNSEYTND